MASQVLSGASNPSYTNNTGENVRVVINYMRSYNAIVSAPGRPSVGTRQELTLNWAGLSITSIYGASASVPTPSLGADVILNPFAIGKSVSIPAGVVRNADIYGNPFTAELPTEILLAPGQTFSALCSIYNIVVIPENG